MIAILPLHEGRFAIVTDVGRDAVDADGAFDEWRRRGRQSRVVLTPRRWRQVSQDVRNPRGDGGKKARSPGRARRKPLKPLRGECRIASAALYARVRFLRSLHARPRMQRASGIPCALVIERRRIFGKPRAYRAARSRRCVSASLRANGSRECAPADRLREAIHTYFAAPWVLR